MLALDIPGISLVCALWHKRRVNMTARRSTGSNNTSDGRQAAAAAAAAAAAELIVHRRRPPMSQTTTSAIAGPAESWPTAGKVILT